MDLPAPVSPVSTARPRENSISSRSIRTMSRIERRASMRDLFLAETQFLEGPGDVGTLVLARLETAGLYKIISVLVPAAVRKIVSQQRRGGTAGMQGNVTRGGADAAVVIAGIVKGVGRHQQRFARPFGIRMLAVDFLEFLRRRLRILPLIHQVQALIVELVRGLLDEGVVLGHKLVPQRAGAASAQGDCQHKKARGQTQLPAKLVARRNRVASGASRYL